MIFASKIINRPVIAFFSARPHLFVIVFPFGSYTPYTIGKVKICKWFLKQTELNFSVTGNLNFMNNSKTITVNYGDSKSDKASNCWKLLARCCHAVRISRPSEVEAEKFISRTSLNHHQFFNADGADLFWKFLPDYFTHKNPFFVRKFARFTAINFASWR